VPHVTPIDRIQLARSGDDRALGQLLDIYRPWLQILASRELDPMLSARLSGSDIVQQTFLEAHRDFQTFRGETEPELIGWLRQILAHNVAEATQVHVLAARRSVHRESGCAYGQDARQDSEFPAASQSSPSSRAMRDERAVQLACAMRELPPDQFEAVRLRYLEGWALAKIAGRLGRSEMAVAGLLKRGLQGLRQRLPLPEVE